jgi:hypothetical protein
MVKQRRHGRFFGSRIDCERVPSLPSSIVRELLEDSANEPRLLTWRNRWDGQIAEVVTIRRGVVPACFPPGEAIEVRRPAGTITDLYVFRRPLPRNGANDLLLECPACYRLRRAVYGWAAGGTTTRSVYRSQWQCRECAGLRYASEGGALWIRSRGSLGRLLGVMHAPRPKPWLPLVSFSTHD